MIKPEEHMGLVKDTVVKLYNTMPVLHRYEVEDLFSIGYLELVKASKSFDETKGFAFSTYAYRSIKNSVYKLLQQEKNVDMHVRSIDTHLVCSIEQGVTNDNSEDNMSLEEYIGDGNCYDDIAISNILLKQCFSSLSNHEKELIILRYFKGTTLKEMNKKYNIPISTASYKINTALKKIKRIFIA